MCVSAWRRWCTTTSIRAAWTCRTIKGTRRCTWRPVGATKESSRCCWRTERAPTSSTRTKTRRCSARSTPRWAHVLEGLTCSSLNINQCWASTGSQVQVCRTLSRYILSRKFVLNFSITDHFCSSGSLCWGGRDLLDLLDSVVRVRIQNSQESDSKDVLQVKHSTWWTLE